MHQHIYTNMHTCAQCFLPGPAHCIQLVHEDDRGAWGFLGRRKQLPHPGSPPPHEHFYEVAPAASVKRDPASAATARASKVLPVPGGPTSKTPAGRRAPIWTYLIWCSQIQNAMVTERKHLVDVEKGGGQEDNTSTHLG